MRTLFFYLFVAPLWLIGAICLIFAVIILSICALIAELEQFLCKVFKMKWYKGKYYQLYMNFLKS